MNEIYSLLSMAKPTDSKPLFQGGRRSFLDPDFAVVQRNECYRFALDYLEEWKDRKTRKPLVIRGARPVGKSYIVSMFAERHFTEFIKIDFEREPGAQSLFREDSPGDILKFLELRFNKKIQTAVPGCRAYGDRVWNRYVITLSHAQFTLGFDLKILRMMNF